MMLSFKGVIGAAEGAAQVILDGLDAETADGGCLVLGNHDFAAAVLEVVDAHLDDPFGIFQGVVFVELDVNDTVLLHLGDGVGGDQFGVEALGHVGQVLEHALDVHHHGVAGAGDDGQFLLQVGAGLGYPVALENFVGRAADAAQLNALGPLGFGVLDDFRLLGRGYDHLGEHRLMAVDDDVDVVFLHDA
jgi:hypothetical protein